MLHGLFVIIPLTLHEFAHTHLFCAVTVDVEEVFSWNVEKSRSFLENLGVTPGPSGVDGPSLLLSLEELEFAESERKKVELC